MQSSLLPSRPACRHIMAASPSTLVPSIPHALASIHAPASITLQRSFKCPCCSVFPHSTHPAFLSAFPSSLPSYYGGISLHIRSIHSSRFSVHSRCSVKIIPFVFFYNTIFHKKKMFRDKNHETNNSTLRSKLLLYLHSPLFLCKEII